MGAIEDGEGDPLDTAREWMNANEDIVNNWLPTK
jgi:ABC-type proline/glycine betaine transport system substrate-binding protein